MTFKYNVNGVGLDAIFDPYISGTKAALTGYTVNGVDLKDLFAPLYLGTSAAATQYKVNGADLNTIFAAKGTAVYALPFNGQTFAQESVKTVGIDTTTYVTTTIKADGTYSIDGLANETPINMASGTWLPAGQAASQYQVQFVVTETLAYEGGGGTITNGAAAYSTCTADRQVKVGTFAGAASSPDKGGQYTVVVNLKRISTGVVQVTTHYYDVKAINHSA